MDMSESSVIKQHLIDPEICIRCNTCEAICPVGAITGEPKAVHQINRDKCIKCGACMAKCRFGAISRQ